MAQNPQLFSNGMPVPFYGELFVLARDGVEFEVDKISGSGKVKAKGTIYLSNVRMVFVASKPAGNFYAFDMPLVVPETENRALYSTHSFKILFKEGGCGTFIPLFFNLINSVRQYNQHVAPVSEPRVDPLRAAQTPVDEMMRHAYVDPNDPSKIYLQQPTPESNLRRRTYHSQGDNTM
ncbi:uncharacterized protein LOC104898932 isoform X2 [Beta vulgaris subsp. vulgaris]|uniref:uncharacterized protein LOC104898932 isoform X2 n=1 Tax=Beta vulgaris subsp. vulgaris TaxID=3555 RepID=UPI002548B37F|nr:uncharacterized protein LOC104898932 isoform X2 [Beta vulgaris subsp. vulgaris]